MLSLAYAVRRNWELRRSSLRWCAANVAHTYDNSRRYEGQ